MKKIYSIYFLLGLFITAFYSCGEDLTPVGPDIAEITHFRNDGPYLFYENGKLKILEVTKDNALNIREESGLPAGLKLDVYSDDNQLLFQVPINKIENFERPAWEDRTEYAKTFAVSDLHGRFDLFAAILKTGEVINDKYEWIYGSNHLVIDGDIFDRGADVLPILWLIYKLEFEAKTVGGRVTTILCHPAGTAPPPRCWTSWPIFSSSVMRSTSSAARRRSCGVTGCAPAGYSTRAANTVKMLFFIGKSLKRHAKVMKIPQKKGFGRNKLTPARSPRDRCGVTPSRSACRRLWSSSVRNRFPRPWRRPPSSRTSGAACRRRASTNNRLPNAPDSGCGRYRPCGTSSTGR